MAYSMLPQHANNVEYNATLSNRSMVSEPSTCRKHISISSGIVSGFSMAGIGKYSLLLRSF